VNDCRRRAEQTAALMAQLWLMLTFMDCFRWDGVMSCRAMAPGGP
jgi:hypothetical protein